MIPHKGLTKHQNKARVTVPFVVTLDSVVWQCGWDGRVAQGMARRHDALTLMYGSCCVSQVLTASYVLVAVVDSHWFVNTGAFHFVVLVRAQNVFWFIKNFGIYATLNTLMVWNRRCVFKSEEKVGHVWIHTIRIFKFTIWKHWCSEILNVWYSIGVSFIFWKIHTCFRLLI